LLHGLRKQLFATLPFRLIVQYCPIAQEYSIHSLRKKQVLQTHWGLLGDFLVVVVVGGGIPWKLEINSPFKDKHY
jgi:hypothetical protein